MNIPVTLDFTGLNCPQINPGGGPSGEYIGNIGVKVSDNNRPVISIRYSFSSSFSAKISTTWKVESEILAPFDLERGLSSSK